MLKFSFTDYDCIGFDLDMTLARYQLTNYHELIYKSLSEYLIKEKKYLPDFLEKPVDKNFIIRGLIADNENGNLLRISPDGAIYQATHGTKWLTTVEIIKYYPNCHWKPTDFFVEAPAVNSDKHLRLLGDFLSIPILLVFARAVDTIDKMMGVQKPYNVLQDIREAMQSIFFGRKLCENNLGIFPKLKENSENIYYKISENLVKWLKDLKRAGKKLFLMTGADVSHAFFTAENTLGPNWKIFFDIVICYAEKPDFFILDNPFRELDGFKEKTRVTNNALQPGKVYSYGNWTGLKLFLAKLCNKVNPKMLYIGDNIIQDVYAPKVYCDMDTIAICEELEAEKMFGFIKKEHPDKEFICSTLWGSFFPSNQHDESFWFNLIKKNAKLCVPSVEYLAMFPIDYEFDVFKP